MCGKQVWSTKDVKYLWQMLVFMVVQLKVLHTAHKNKMWFSRSEAPADKDAAVYV